MDFKPLNMDIWLINDGWLMVIGSYRMMIHELVIPFWTNQQNGIISGLRTLNILNQVLNLYMTPRPFHCRNPGVPVTFSLKQPRGSAGGLLMRWRVVASHGQNSWLAKLYVVKFSAVCSTHFRYKASFANVVMGPPILFQMVTCAALCCRRRWWW